MNNTISLEKKLMVYRHYIAKYILEAKSMDLDTFYEAKDILLLIKELSDEIKDNKNYNCDEKVEEIKKYIVKIKKVEI